ncbi:peptidylprolyl isomerase [Paraferrimonas sp. SM1919]|uniref:FKBP-type peptidyl-prolyl cis-trans isomerase n=1 Tax=Paraferrimonas sp. SM1919 TaxID=2662263 RepID=UPI0013D56F6C|nr:peptidylprolyl isomerase [Paraferrimonas sp. SM1919]
MKITANCAVTITYHLYNSDDQLLESATGDDNVAYLHGAENMIPGVEQALEGKTVGDKLSVTVEPEDGYGPLNDGLIQTVPMDAFGEVEDIVPGMTFMAQTEHGQLPVRVLEVQEDGVVLDGNHPYAGQVLKFDIEVVKVEQASEQDIAHGHLHVDGQCGH